MQRVEVARADFWMRKEMRYRVPVDLDNFCLTAAADGGLYWLNRSPSRTFIKVWRQGAWVQLHPYVHRKSIDSSICNGTAAKAGKDGTVWIDDDGTYTGWRDGRITSTIRNRGDPVVVASSDILRTGNAAGEVQRWEGGCAPTGISYAGF